MRLKYVDSNHAYYLDGKRCKSVTTVAKVPDDTYTLEQWRRRQTVIGFANAPHLLADVEPDNKRKLDELCEQAFILAGGQNAAQRGTAAHKVIEDKLTGEATGEGYGTSYLWQTWDALLAGANLRPVPSMSERVVVYPDTRICGRFDVVLERPDGTLVIADLKTGTGAVTYPHSVAIQLALYANAPMMAAATLGLLDETTDFVDMPPMDKRVGYMIHIPVPPDDEFPPAVYAVNLKLGWKAVEQVVLPALRWRAIKTGQLIKPVA